MHGGMFNMKLCALLMIAAMAGLAGASHAQAPAGGSATAIPAPSGPVGPWSHGGDRRAAMDAARKACQADMQTLCAGKTGHDAMICMRDNRDKVSPACRDAIAKVRHHRHWFHRGWFRRGPNGFGPGGPGFGLPSPEMKAAREAAKTACEPDMKALCAGKTGRDARMCLRENRDKVSQVCKDARAKARRPHGPGQGRDRWRPPPGPPAASR